MNQKELFNQLVDIIEETKYFLKKQSLPIFHLNHEPDPGDFHFPWKALTKKSSEQKAKETKEKLAKKVQKLRKKSGLSQEELAEKIKISRTHMGHIEQGRRAPSIKVMTKLASVFKVKVSDLF